MYLEFKHKLLKTIYVGTLGVRLALYFIKVVGVPKKDEEGPVGVAESEPPLETNLKTGHPIKPDEI